MTTAAAAPSRWILGLVMAGTLAARLLTAPAFVESPDGWAFVSGVERYSVAEGRPHWPGYPLYIALGKLVRLGTGDAAAALHLLAVLSSTLVGWPLMVLASRWAAAAGSTPTEADRAAAFAGGLWMVLPGSWTTGTEILSDPTGLLMAALLLLASWRAAEWESRGGPWLVLAAAMAVGLLAVRLAYAPLVAPLILAGLRVWGGGRRSVWRIAALLLLVVLVAMGGLGVFGGPGYAAAAIHRWGEHFGSWPRRVLADGRLGQRVVDLARTFVVYGWGGWWPGLPLGRVAPTAALLVLVPAGLVRMARHPRRDVLAAAALFGAPYTLLVLLTQDPALLRYGLPLLALACLAAPLALPRGRPGTLTALAAWASVAATALPIVLERRAEPPLGHRLAQYAHDHLASPRTTILVSSDVRWTVPFLERIAPGTRLQVVEADEIQVVAHGLRDEGKAVYATRPPATRPEEWAPVACFTRSRLLESRGPYELWLYELAPTRTGR